MSMFGTQANTIRQTCRACHNICFTPEGSPAIGTEGYRCEACEAAGYERYDFDKSLPRPEGVTPEAAIAEPGEAPDTSEARPSDEPKSAQGVTPEPWREDAQPVAEGN
jgi:hypothetical protein